MTGLENKWVASTHETCQASQPPFSLLDRAAAWRHASEQYFTLSQFLAHDFRHVIGFSHTQQSLNGKLLLLPLNGFFIQEV